MIYRPCDLKGTTCLILFYCLSSVDQFKWEKELSTESQFMKGGGARVSFRFISFCCAESAAINEEPLGTEQPAVTLLGCHVCQSYHMQKPVQRPELCY